MKGCRRIEGIMAAALYEAPSPEDARELEQHLADCSACRAEMDLLRQMTAEIPCETPEYTGDLRPILRDLRQRTSRRWFASRPVFASLMALAAIAVVVGAAYGPAMLSGSAPRIAVEASDDSALAGAMARSADLASAGDLSAARDTLAEALAALPEDARAGDAWLDVARLQYAMGHYEDAYTAYETVRADYPDAWRAGDEDAKVRYELLADARSEAYAPLVDLERARKKGTSGFEALEGILARRPESAVAREALAVMCAAATGDPSASSVDALRNVRERCTDPTALARVDLAMGHAYWREMDDPGQARMHFTAAAESENPVVARLANDALAVLASANP